MSSAKVTIAQQLRGLLIPSIEGSYAGIVVNSVQGEVNTPRLITSVPELKEVFGIPDPKLGTSMYSAIIYLGQGNKLWVSRTSKADARYAGLLLRSKVESYSNIAGEAFNSNSSKTKSLVDGLTEVEFSKFQFPIYSTNKEFGTTESTLEGSKTSGLVVAVNKITDLSIGDELCFEKTTLEEVNKKPDVTTVKVIDMFSKDNILENLVVKTAVTASVGTEVRMKSSKGDEVTSFTPKVFVIAEATNTTNVLVTSTDMIPSDATLVFGEDVESEFVKKTIYETVSYFLKVDNPVEFDNVGMNIYKVTQSEFEERDSLLVTYLSPSVLGNRVNIGVRDSKDYEDASIIDIYVNNNLVESFEVTMEYQLDGYQRQLHAEDKINGKSKWIKCRVNRNNTDSNGKVRKLLPTTNALWRKLPEDLFGSVGLNLTEDVLIGHTEVKLTNTTKLVLGDRIKFTMNHGKVSKEYKITKVDTASKAITIDRPIEEKVIENNFIDDEGIYQTAELLKFDKTTQDVPNGIIDGIQHFKVVELTKPLLGLNTGSVIEVDGEFGTLLDSGAGKMLGGTQGGAPSIGDHILTLQTLYNSEKTPITLMMDGGVADPAYAQAIKQLVIQHKETSHGYLSDPLEAEEMDDYKKAIAEYRSSLNLNDDKCSLFAGWIKYYCPDNQRNVWISPESFAAASQSYTTKNFDVYYPAAGWKRSIMTGALDVKVVFDEPDRDFLVERQINPIRKKENVGLAIWGNETLATQPSPLQLRSVAMLIIKIKLGLLAALEYVNFDLNDEDTWGEVEGALNAFMRDEIGKGVYAYSIAVGEIITDSDKDNRRMPVFLGIQPTLDIKEIPVTLAIFSNSMEISV